MLIVSVNLFLMRIVSVLFLFWEGERRKIEHWRAPMNNCQTNTSWRTTTKSRNRILDFLSHSVSTLFTFPSHYCIFFDVAVLVVVVFFLYLVFAFIWHVTHWSFLALLPTVYFTQDYKSCVGSPVFERTHTRHSSSNMNIWFFCVYLPRLHLSKRRPRMLPRQSIETPPPSTEENELVPPFPRRLISMAIVVLVSCRPDEDIQCWRRAIRCCTDREMLMKVFSSSSNMTLSVTGVGELLFDYGCRL